MVLNGSDLRALDGMRLNPRKAFGGRVRGERMTTKKGVSIEFADYRDYSEGDDLRHLDWNVLARLDSAVMRTYRDEEDLQVYLFIDNSASMQFGDPSKAERAHTLGLALGYVALIGGDAVLPVSVGAREAKRSSLRGRASFSKLRRWEPAAPSMTLADSFRAFAKTAARPGLIVLCSDGMDPDIAGSLQLLAGRGHEIFFVQVLDALDLDPDLEGDLRLLDSESGKSIEVTANSSVLREYRDGLAKHIAAIENQMLRSGGRHAVVSSDKSFRDVLRDVWRREGWIK